MFKDPDLGIMRDQYLELKSQNPHLQPPSAPSKSRLTEMDRQKEEEELQMALKLSIQQERPADSKPAPQSGSSTHRSQPEIEAPTTNPVPSGTTAATVSRVRALYDFQATDPDELTFSKGDIIAVLESVYKDWWKGLLRGQTGIFPLNYVEKLADPSPEELQREAQTEAEVFAEIKNVEKLLTLLSTASPDLNNQDNDDIGVGSFAFAIPFLFWNNILTLLIEALLFDSCNTSQTHRINWQILTEKRQDRNLLFVFNQY